MIKSQPKIDDHIEEEAEIIKFDEDNLKYYIHFHF